VKRRALVVAAPSTLEAVLRLELGDRAQALLARGAVYVDGRRAREGGVGLRAGQKVLVVLEESGAPVEQRASAPPLEVLYEDEEVIAVNKPAGVTAQPTAGRVGDSLVDLVSTRLGRPAGLVHRLDRETSGVTIFGKVPKATARLAAAFREGRAEKEYLAVTRGGLPAEGVIDLPLSKDPSRPGRWRASRRANGVPALTHFTRLKDGAFSVVALFPKTGRTHQLRAHLAALGFPIVGDRLYGGPEGPRCLLHARVLRLDGLRLEAPVPADLAAFT
jgi:23S rRNA pseudouridine1911/1915/1917 synthase